jgi:hypothetical protein
MFMFKAKVPIQQGFSFSAIETLNSDGAPGGATDTDVNFDAVADLQIDIVTLALKCDLTRVVSLMLGNHQSDFTVPEAGKEHPGYGGSGRGGRYQQLGLSALW